MTTIYSELQNLSVKSGSVVLGTPDFLGTVTTLTASTPASSRTYTFPDVLANSNIKMGVDLIQGVTGATTLSASNSGAVVLVSNAGSGYSITLPSPTQGLNFKLYVSGALSGAVTVAAGSAIVLGSLLSSDGTAITGGAITTAVSNVIFGTTAKIGDRLEFFGNGTNWLVIGYTALHTSITVS